MSISSYHAYLGIDNGTSGSLGIISENLINYIPTPTKKEQSYTKAKNNISRLDHFKFKELLENILKINNIQSNELLIGLERPLVNPARFNTTGVALRCLESQLVIIEQLNIPHIYLDSKDWQRKILPEGTKDREELKRASKDIGLRLFPQFKDFIIKQKDADGILISEYLRRNY